MSFKEPKVMVHTVTSEIKEFEYRSIRKILSYAARNGIEYQTCKELEEHLIRSYNKENMNYIRSLL